MKPNQSAFSTIELLLLVTIIALVTVTASNYFLFEEDEPILADINYHRPSLEMEYISSIFINEIIKKGNVKFANEIFSKDFIGYINPEKYTPLSSMIEQLEHVHQTDIFYNPRLIDLKYKDDYFICYWSTTVDQYGIPSPSKDSELIGEGIYKIKDGKIIHGTYRNTFSNLYLAEKEHK